MFSYSEMELKVLKNFASINNNMLVKSNRFEIVNAPKKSIVGLYNLSEAKDHDPFAIYNLSEFITVIEKSGANAQLEVKDKYVEIVNVELGTKVKYAKAPLEFVPEVKDPTDKFVLENHELEFTLSSEKLNTIFSISSLLKAQKLFMETTEAGDIRLICSGETMEEFSNPLYIPISKSEYKKSELDKDMLLYIRIPELMVIAGEYDVEVCKKGITHWKNKNNGIEYFIGCKIQD